MSSLFPAAGARRFHFARAGLSCRSRSALSARVWDAAGGIDGIVPLTNVIRGGEERVVGGLKFALECSFQFGLALGGARRADEIFELKRIGFVVEEEPRTVEIAHIGVARGANAAIFAPAMLACPFAERGDAGDKGRAV